jgi:DNA polymerase-3 subunit gamma/tau
MSLYQRVRPGTLDEIRGNDSTVKALVQYCRAKPENRGHVLMFRGPVGCGKTTMALAVCRTIGATELAITRLNGANLRGIDTVREILAKSKLKPIDCDIKVYIIDESHQLTKAAQEAFLEGLEFYPEHVYYIFCTTNPENMIPALRSRITEFEVKPLSKEHIRGLVLDTAKGIEFDISDDIADAIVQLSEGCSRKALICLEMIAPLEDEMDMLDLLVKGTKDDSEVIDLCKLMAMYPKARKKRWVEAMSLVKSLTKGTDAEGIRRAILGYFGYKLVDCRSVEDAQDYTRLITSFDKTTVYSGKAVLFGLVFRACFGESETV